MASDAPAAPSPDAPSDEPSDDLLQRCAFALRSAFPDLDGAELTVAFDTPAELALDTPELSLRFPRAEGALASLELQAALLPHLRGFLTPAVPLFERRADPSRDWPYGCYAAARVAGRPMRAAAINDENIERLVRGLAQFLYELHHFPLPRARSRGLAPPRRWREQAEELARESAAALRPLLRFSEHARIRRWWRSLLNDEAAWSYQPAVVHGGLREEHLLLDAMLRDIVGVVGWERAQAGDPAADFAAVVDAYGSDFGWRVMTRYGELGGAVDAAFFRRVRQQGVVRRFAEAAAAINEAEDERVVAALEALRASAALHRG